MEALLDALEDIGRPKDLEIEKAIEGGPKCPAFTRLAAELSAELRTLRSLEESVNATQSADDASAFLLELSSFLKELECPHLRLTAGHVSSRLRTVDDRLLLLDFLISELMIARMSALNERRDDMEVAVRETPTAKDLKDILIAFKFNKPPPDIGVDAIFSKLEAKLKENLQKEGQNYVGKPLYNKATPEKQWNEIRSYYERLRDEYKMRREMLITRLDCTIRSFEWSDRGATKREEIQSVYRPLRAALKNDTSVKLSDFLAARSTLLTIKKTSDSSVRINTKSQINKVIIGKVPDRGGRPSEQEPPPPEMPSWQKQRSQGAVFNRGGGNRGGGGGRGGGRGGNSGFGGGSKVQGNWNQPKDRDSVNDGFNGRNQNYDNRQGYQDNRNNYQDTRPGSNYQNKGYDNNYANQNQGYQQGYQNQYQGQNFVQNQGDYHSQNYSNQRQESQSFHNQGFQGRGGRYQNEHDDRANCQNNVNNPRGRGRSNYNRGGRY